MSNAVRIIKRYHNRKLYDTQESCYVTLEELSELVRQGEEIQVIDNRTQEDLTSVTLAQIIFETEKSRRSVLSLDVLKHLIQSGGAVVRDLVESGVKEISHVRHEVADFVDTKIRPAVEKIHQLPTIQSELKTLKKRIGELEGKIKKKIKRPKE